LKSDKEFVLKAVEQDGRCFQHASEELKFDKDFILKAVEKDVRCFQFIS
jgi:hypothetical protein